MCPRDLVEDFGRDVMIPFPSIEVLAAAEFVQKNAMGSYRQTDYPVQTVPSV